MVLSLEAYKSIAHEWNQLSQNKDKTEASKIAAELFSKHQVTENDLSLSQVSWPVMPEVSVQYRYAYLRLVRGGVQRIPKPIKSWDVGRLPSLINKFIQERWEDLSAHDDWSLYTSEHKFMHKATVISSASDELNRFNWERASKYLGKSVVAQGEPENGETLEDLKYRQNVELFQRTLQNYTKQFTVTLPVIETIPKAPSIEELSSAIASQFFSLLDGSTVKGEGIHPYFSDFKDELSSGMTGLR